MAQTIPLYIRLGVDRDLDSDDDPDNDDDDEYFDASQTVALTMPSKKSAGSSASNNSSSSGGGGGGNKQVEVALYVWGWGSSGGLGLGRKSFDVLDVPTLRPVPLPARAPAAAAANDSDNGSDSARSKTQEVVGLSASCHSVLVTASRGRKAEGFPVATHVYAWGNNDYGKCGVDVLPPKVSRPQLDLRTGLPERKLAWLDFIHRPTLMRHLEAAV